MKIYSINCSVSMAYDIEAETEAEAQEQAIELFLSDVIKNLDIDVETLGEE